MVHIRRFAVGLVVLGLLTLLAVVLAKYFFATLSGAWLVVMAYLLGSCTLSLWKGGKYN